MTHPRLPPQSLIAWIAAQPWCNGSVGVYGKSWGGFNGLQLAARAPPALKGVVSLYSTDDRYADDVHYVGGAVLGSEMLSWASIMFAWNARPPSPSGVAAPDDAGRAAVVGSIDGAPASAGDPGAPDVIDLWLSRWRERLEGACEPWVVPWLTHQARDDYWRHGSSCEDVDRIVCPIFMIGGWRDAYTNAVFRVVRDRPDISTGMVGPWSHQWPDVALPGPGIAFCDLVVQFWRAVMLNGGEAGPTSESKAEAARAFPMKPGSVRLWLRDAVPPSAGYDKWPGRWVQEERWPPKADTCTNQRYMLQASGALELAGDGTETTTSSVDEEARRSVETDLLVGAASGEWLSYGDADGPTDQSEDDRRSLCWNTAPLAEDTELFGTAALTCAVTVDQATATLVGRLCDVSPGGSSTLISRGVLNLSHVRGHAVGQIEPLPIGEAFEVQLSFDTTTYRLPAGHHLRLAISPSYFPLVWPAPDLVVLQIVCGSSSALTVPVRQRTAALDAADTSLPDLGESTAALCPGPAVTTVRPSSFRRSVKCDADGFSVTVDGDDGRMVLPDGTVYDETMQEKYSIETGKPLSAVAECTHDVVMAQPVPGAAETLVCSKISTVSVMRATHSSFVVENQLRAFFAGRTRADGVAEVTFGDPLFERSWKHEIPRQCV